MIWIIKKVNRIPTHCDVSFECSLARGHVIKVSRASSLCRVINPECIDSKLTVLIIKIDHSF